MTVGGAQQPRRDLGFPSRLAAGRTGPAQPYREDKMGRVGERASTLLQKAGNKRTFCSFSFLNMVFLGAVLASLIA